ncbi:heavy-metal-associated domain-containing protein [Nocardioides sp.]|uniref:heavy-metal-associated domain-containing protein n=1 Tax=Nocardioides sp. TaxID=35761 RepID=UPI0019B3950C|nr:heavy-metal-associated domain-containing protein [Nocardioides sp.]MBC7275700.1 heavy-metal-associated domain-containing protein [Nocardioides sp.]
MENEGILYDRAAAARILAEVAGPDFLSGPAPAVPAVSVDYRVEELRAEAGGALTTGQRRYLESYMRPCRPDQVVSGTHRVTWRDSRGIANSGHIGPGPLGPILPIAAREAVIAVADTIAAADAVTARSNELGDDDLDVLADTTTDQEPAEIFRVGAEAAGRALVQHGMLAGQVGIEDPVEFAEAMLASGMYGTVASTWFWELQASTYRRGMLPARLERAGGRLRYTADTVALLAEMKRRTIADAHEVMDRARAEGLGVRAAIQRHHVELDQISRQYALLPVGERPVCLGQRAQQVDGRRVQPLAAVAEALTGAFAAAVASVRVAEAPELASRDVRFAAGEQEFGVPDMTCRHCRVTITAVFDAQAAELIEVDLHGKVVRARFTDAGQRDRVFADLRDSGYTVAEG